MARADQKSIPALLRRIAAADGRIASMGNDGAARRRWNLSGDRLEVLFGNDNEIGLHHRASGRFITQVPTKVRKGFEAIVFHALRDQLTGAPDLEDDGLELRYKPGNGLQTAERFAEVEKTMIALGEEHGWGVAVGPGHWHSSIVDTGLKGPAALLLNAPNPQGPFPDRFSELAHLYADNLVALQRLMPALFLRPERSDDDLATFASFTKKVGAGPTRDTTVRLNGNPDDRYGNKSFAFELRMSHLAPHVPLLLMQHALELALKGEAIEPSKYNSRVVTLTKAAPYFLGGPGRYLQYLKTTAQSGYLDRHFPELKPDLIDRCATSYEAFLLQPDRRSGQPKAEAILTLKKLAAFTTTAPQPSKLRDEGTRPRKGRTAAKRKILSPQS